MQNEAKRQQIIVAERSSITLQPLYYLTAPCETADGEVPPRRASGALRERPGRLLRASSPRRRRKCDVAGARMRRRGRRRGAEAPPSYGRPPFGAQPGCLPQKSPKSMQNAAIWPRIYAERSNLAQNRCRTQQVGPESMQNAAIMPGIDAERSNLAPKRCRTLIL